MATRRKIRTVRPELHRPPTDLPRCPVEGKLCFPDERAAEEEIFECRMLLMFHNKRRRKETRSYLCDHCEAFHLTAMKVPPSHVSPGSRNGENMAPTNKNSRRQPLRPAPRTSGGYNSGSSGTDYSAGAGWGGFSYDSSSSSSDSDSSSSSSCDSNSSSSSSSDSGGGGCGE